MESGENKDSLVVSQLQDNGKVQVYRIKSTDFGIQGEALFQLNTGFNKLLNLLVFDDFAVMRVDSNQPLQIALKPLPEDGLINNSTWETKIPFGFSDIYYLFFGTQFDILDISVFENGVDPLNNDQLYSLNVLVAETDFSGESTIMGYRYEMAVNYQEQKAIFRLLDEEESIE